MIQLTFAEWLTIIGMMWSVLAAACVGTFAILKWFSKRFASIEAKIEEVEEKIIDKLEYHEKYDDQRFASMSNDIWSLRVRGAARDGLNITQNGKS